jgi:DinB superfamily
MVNSASAAASPLHADLIEMLAATREAERDLFALLDPAVRDAPRRIGEWSAKDVLAHLAAWREVEVKRLRGEPDGTAPDESDDDANARIQAERAGWTWEQVVAAAESSIDELAAAIGDTSAQALAESDGLVAGIGSNGANHAMSHLSDVAGLADGGARFGAFAQRIQEILERGHLPDRDAAVMIYNLGCHYALSGDLPAARRLVGDALHRQPDLLEWATQDPDLSAIRDEIPGLAGA